MLHILLYMEVSEEDFFEHFWKLPKISCIIFKTNNKIDFGSSKIHKLPFCSVSNVYDTDTLIGFDTVTQEILLFYILEDINLGKFYLKNILQHLQLIQDLYLTNFRKLYKQIRQNNKYNLYLNIVKVFLHQKCIIQFTSKKHAPYCML